MALKRKDFTVQFRVEMDLHEEFRKVCESRGMKVSQGLQRFMLDVVRTEQAKSRSLKTE